MRKIFAISLAALVLFGCAKEADTVIGKKVSYQVKIESTKAVLADGTNSGYSIKWKEGDKIAFQLSDDSVQEAVVTVDGTGAHVSVTLPDATSVTDAWFPSNNKVKPTGIPAIQVAETMNIPLVKSSIAGKTITFTEVVDWAIIRVPLKKGANGDARKLQFIKVKTNNAALNPQVIQLNTNATLTDEVQNFDFVVPVGEYTPVEFIVRDSNDLEYRRKATANFTTASHTVYSINTIADVDDTGRHIWFMGSGQANTGEAPLNYWFVSNGTPSTSNIARNTGYMTVTTSASGTKFRADIAPICYSSSHVKICSNGSDVVNSSSDADRLAVHVGNYPIFAIKMTNQNSIGTGRTYNWDTNSKDGDNTTNYKGSLGGPTKGLTSTDIPEIGDGNIVNYWDLTSRSFATGGLAINTSVLYFYTWQLKFADIVATSAPSFNVYWAGFFNSVSELEAFAAAH